MRAVCVALILTLLAPAAWANARITVLMDVLRTAELVDIFRAEGLEWSQDLDTLYLDGQGGAFWQAQVEQIFDEDAVLEILRRALEDGLTDGQIDEAIAYLASEPGQHIAGLEVAARRAMTDPDVDEAARAHYRALLRNNAAVTETVAEFIAVNDLLERNVTGAMSVNLQFLTGLSEGGYSDQSETEILDEVWRQQAALRADTEEWLGAYLVMAYEPLEVSFIEGHLSFAGSETGRALNAAIFDGFEPVYRGVAYALGRAVALNADGDEI